MVQISRTTFTVTPTGIGRKDFSQNVEQSVEPMIRSYQQDYWVFETYEVEAGETRVEEIELPADTVVMLYNFFLSVPMNSLIYLNIDTWFPDYNAYVHLADSIGYQNLKIPISVGFPVYVKYRISMTNYGDVDLNMHFSAHGILTEEEIYEGILIPEPT